MPRFRNYVAQGVIPATLLAFNDDFSIDEASTRKHLRDVAAVDGLSAITVNGHASEIHACSFEEQTRILALTMDEIGDTLPVINGVYADGSIEAAKIARMAEKGGASALLVFPPHSIGRGGGMSRPESILAHFRMIADATDLPFIAFQYPYADGYAYPLDTLVRMADEIPSFTAIKDGCYDAVKHERHIHVLQNLSRPINVLTTHSPWLMASLTMGCKGLLSGSGSIIPDLQVALWQAIQAKDLARAQAINERIYPTAQCFYSHPSADMHNRMKEGLVLLGRLPKAVVRPPLAKLPAAEIEKIAQALKDARLGRDGAMLDNLASAAE
ncbi:MAG: dihydrodipicolinate synthase family protein [Alphaproteobacteria bacterium]|nr:dihydrodipicolinate synthase family protein [Alphaproteobacteria bacterium]